MSYYLTEKEQIAQLKMWWQRYGKYLAMGIVGGSLIMMGWQHWQSTRETQREQASILYETLLHTMETQQAEKAKAEANHLIKTFKGTVYSDLSQLMLAKIAIEKKDYATAQQCYDNLINHAKNKSLRQLVRIRYARLLIAKQAPQQALSMLATVEDKAFLMLIEQVREQARVLAKKPLTNPDLNHPIKRS